ncbi:MAG: hypothetical protein GYB50_25680 [Rhodobacteraceae bacterium]|uniref:hypothetical protein n=1 Tax=Salipiger thiooxidans TaxID=282683 RepID=UPI001A8F0336|nr:hypothetical protein [Salipiger thiooxidans]MBN8190382.1 hypothetical protein [Salipiger thiooxidans]MBR9841244.1 hypothetical protein [Paracoccaceae bacterium]
MRPADLVRRDRLADTVCHGAQMEIWADELRQELAAHLRSPRDYEEVPDLADALKTAIRHVFEGAFSHPEILGIPRGHDPRRTR